MTTRAAGPAVPGAPLAWIGAELAELRRADLHRRLLPAGRRDGRTAIVDGREAINLSSNDYLGVASDLALHEEFWQEARHGALAAAAPSSSSASSSSSPPPSSSAASSSSPGAMLATLGLGGSSSRLLAGHTPELEALERELAALVGREASLCFGSGYHANTGLIPALARPGDVVFSDALNHASIVDGCRLSGAAVHVYRHLDLQHLDELLRTARPASGRALVVSESLFSMDGDGPDLRALVALKERHGAALLVDEAHAVGVFGRGGAGQCAAAGVGHRVEVLVGTCGKALGSSGAFAACDAEVKEYLVNRARTLIYTTAPPPAVVAWTRFVVRRLPDLETRRERVQSLAARLRQALAARRLAASGADGQHVHPGSPIVAVVLGENAAAVGAAERLRERGYLCFPIRPPTVPAGTARLRLSLTAALTWPDLQPIPELLAEARA